MSMNKTLSLLATLMAAALTAACGNGSPPSEEEPPHEDDSTHEEPRPSGDGETCATAFDISVAQQEGGGSTVGAADDLEGSCTGRGAPERVYRVTLDEPAGLIARAEGIDYDVGLYVLDASCGAEIPGACSDAMMNQLAVEEVKIPLLQPGDYYVVVEGYGLAGEGSPEGEYTLDVVLYPGGVCVGDPLDEGAGDGSPATATFVGGGDLDTLDLGNPQTTGPDPFPLTLCEGNADYFAFGHMGGPLSVSVTTTRGDGAVVGQILHGTVDGTALEAGNFGLDEGDVLGDAPFNGEAERGYYLLKVSGSDLGIIGTDYAIALAHACEPDDFDDAAPELDDADYGMAQIAAFEPLSAPLERTVCLTDRDAFVLDNILPGNVQVTLGGGSSLGVDVQVVDRSAAAATVAPYTAFETAVDGDDLVVTLSDAPAGRYVLLVDGGETPPEAPLSYTFQATFDGVAEAPANDGCDGAEALVASQSSSPVSGRTVSASDDLDGPCNGDGRAGAGDGAPEVLYTLQLEAESDVELVFDGSPTGFVGSLYVFQYPGSCPANVDELVPVEQHGAPACLLGGDFSMRLRDLPAGDYLVVVDGVYRAAIQTMMGTIPEVRTRGAFELAAVIHPAGLPPLQGCVAADRIDLPESGGVVDLSFQNGELENELMSYGTCSQGGRGREKVFLLEPPTDATVNITVTGYDTVLSLREADCEFGDQVACNDDVDFDAGDYTSRITGANLAAGTTYYLIVDAWTADAEGTAALRIERP